MHTLSSNNDGTAAVRPYQLRGPKYALWFDLGILGKNGQTAVEQYLCGGRKIVTPQGQPLDEQSQEIVRAYAVRRGVFIPPSVF